MSGTGPRVLVQAGMVWMWQPWYGRAQPESCLSPPLPPPARPLSSVREEGGMLGSRTSQTLLTGGVMGGENRSGEMLKY